MQVQEAASIALLCLHGTCEFGILGTPLGKNGFRDKRACPIRDSRWGHGGCALCGMGRGGWVESSQAGGLSRGTAGRGMVGLDPARQIPHPTLAQLNRAKEPRTQRERWISKPKLGLMKLPAPSPSHRAHSPSQRHTHTCHPDPGTCAHKVPDWKSCCP